jgi:hypothetical protein
MSTLALLGSPTLPYKAPHYIWPRITQEVEAA